jgi:hypothetical protein
MRTSGTDGPRLASCLYFYPARASTWTQPACAFTPTLTRLRPHVYLISHRSSLSHASSVTPSPLPPCLLGMKTVGKPLNRFLLLHLNTKTKEKVKVKAVKPEIKTNTNLRNIENFKNELIQAEFCRTQSEYEISIRNIDSYRTKCITINKYMRQSA